jgi:DNA polymerase, archaea type
MAVPAYETHPLTRSLTHPFTKTMDDTVLFGWDDTPAIVSVWADREGNAVVWRRVGGELVCERVRYRPWLYAAHLDDLAHVGASLAYEGSPADTHAPFVVRELDGAPGAFRYLIMARNGRDLEQALLEGARRRVGRELRSLYGVHNDYYRVGPVEQYLMQTGRVYFRGLRYSDLHRMQIDFETTALDPLRGRIFLAAIRDSRGFELLLEAPEESDEAELIARLCAVVRERDPDVIENHNLFGFDLPFLEARAAALNVPLLLGRPGGPRKLERVAERPPDEDERRRTTRYTLAGRELIDTIDAVRRHDFVARDLPSHRLKDVARHFGIATSERTYLAGAEVYPTYRSDPEAVRRYALDDVREVDGLSQRLMTPVFALAGMAPRRYERLGNAGPAMGILEPILVRAYLRAGAALPGPDLHAPAEPHTGGALHLFATGIAQHVVKADIASLYPSLMIAYAIGPECDQLGALLTVVQRLTELRLRHKRAAREAAQGTLEAGHHTAMQAAMKLIINAAYGYMGAGSMALFADRNAADEVTRRGREVLGQVVAALQARGVALIEADTDGVFFAVPPGYDEQQERALVSEVAALLPPGIRLEYEGRYQAMLSHEVKNYAVLTYDGQLIVRGVALRSSRNEPFGDAFLHKALGCALVGDVVGARSAFLETVHALRERRFTVAQVATRARLSKGPKEYATSRGRSREAPYEALMNAGRLEWQRGERVRYYRNSAGQYCWLPDERDERVERRDEWRDYDIEHYIELLVNSYASRLKKAFAPEDFAQLMRLDGQLGLFDRPLEGVEPLWIRP